MKHTKTAIFWPQNCKFSSHSLRWLEALLPDPHSLRWLEALLPDPHGLRRPRPRTPGLDFQNFPFFALLLWNSCVRYWACVPECRLWGVSTRFIQTFKKRVFQQKFRPKYAYILEKKGCKIAAAPGVALRRLGSPPPNPRVVTPIYVPM